MSWTNLHKWIVRYSDSAAPDLEELDRFLLCEDINATTANGSSPLHLAAVGGNPAVLAHLVKNRNNKEINQRNSNFETPLHWACFTSLEHVKILIENGADPQAKDDKNNTPLHFAAQAGNTAIVEYLLNNNFVDINTSNVNGSTALEIACEERELKTISSLVGAGASVCDLVTDYMYRGENRVVMRLLKNTKPETIVDKQGRNPLHLAVLYDNYRIAEKLVKIYPWKNMKDTSGKTPLALTKRSNSPKLIALLSN